MARIEFGNFETSVHPAWMGDFAGRDYLVPGGANIDAAAYVADADGNKVIPAGTLVGRTYAERAAGDPFGPADAADDEIYLTANTVDNADEENSIDLYRNGATVKENFLPEWDTWQADLATYQTLIDAMRERYATTIGVE